LQNSWNSMLSAPLWPNFTPLNFGTNPISVLGWQVHVYTPKCMISKFSVYSVVEDVVDPFKKIDSQD
jgi:hypothetical protein